MHGTDVVAVFGLNLLLVVTTSGGAHAFGDDPDQNNPVTSGQYSAHWWANEAQQIAKGSQRPGQTKEQTRLIAQGIQKGIDQYKKQQKAKARELDKRLKQVRLKNDPEPEVPQRIAYRQHWLPWSLLVATWLCIGFYLLFT